MASRYWDICFLTIKKHYHHDLKHEVFAHFLAESSCLYQKLVFLLSFRSQQIKQHSTRTSLPPFYCNY